MWKKKNLYQLSPGMHPYGQWSFVGKKQEGKNEGVIFQWPSGPRVMCII